MEHDEPILNHNINVYYDEYKNKNTLYLNLIKCYALLLVIRDKTKQSNNKKLFKTRIINILLNDYHNLVAYYIYYVYRLIYKDLKNNKEQILKLSADIVIKFHQFDYIVILLMKRYYDKFIKHINNNDKFTLTLTIKILNSNNNIDNNDINIINNHFKYFNMNL